MRLKLLITILLLAQIVLFGDLLYHIGSGQQGLVVAHAGQVSFVQITPASPWGGSSGMLSPAGQTSISITANTITQQNVSFNDPKNNCSRTELVAAVTATNVTAVGPVDPAYADTQLGFDSNSPLSVERMFTTQETYSLAGQNVTLWSTRTHGALTDFIEGVGQANGQIVFVTETVRNGEDYQGNPANYQFILPPGAWQVTYDGTDVCSVLSQYQQPNATPTSGRLVSALPDRICTGQPTTMYAAYTIDRTYCLPQDVGGPTCGPAKNVQAEIDRNGSTLQTTTTGADGSIGFTPGQSATYVLHLKSANQSVTTRFTTQTCLAAGQTSSGTTVQEPAPSVTLLPGLNSSSPQTQSPGTVAARVGADYTLISILTVLIVGLSLYGYYESFRDASPFLLRLRIWWYEHIMRR